MDVATRRTAAAATACAPLFEFVEGPVLQARRACPDPCDFLFGNPHGAPLPGMVEAIRAAAVPRGADHFAYKFNEDVACEAVAAALRARLGTPFAPADVVMTKGAWAALAVVVQTIVEPGDEVVYVRPPWFLYAGLVVAAGGTPVSVACDEQTHDLDLPAIEAALTPRTRAVIVNSPNNPTGRVYPEATLKRLAGLLEAATRRAGRPVYLISDEAYHRILMPGTVFTSPTAHYPYSFLIYTYAKTLLNPGQRLGYVALPPGMPDAAGMRRALFTTQIAGGHGFPDAVMQYALPALESECIDLAAVARRRDAMLEALRAARYDVRTPEGTFYLFPRCPEPDDNAFALRLARRGVFVLPGSTVEMPGWFRISLTATDDMVTRSLDHFAAARTEALQGGEPR